MGNDFKQILSEAENLGRQLRIVLEAPAGTVTLAVLETLMPSTTNFVSLIPDLVEIREAAIEAGDFASAAVVTQIIKRLLTTGEEVQALVSRHMVGHVGHEEEITPENDLEN
jgi:hypothetical protein